jgi:hypothetical protein
MLSRQAGQVSRRASFEIGACVLLTLFMAGGMGLFWYKQKRDAEPPVPATPTSNSVATTSLPEPTFDKAPTTSTVHDSDFDRNAEPASYIPSAEKPSSLPPGPSQPTATFASNSSSSGRADSKSLFASTLPPPPPAAKKAAPPSTSGPASAAQHGFKAPVDPTKPKGCGCGKKK